MIKGFLALAITSLVGFSAQADLNDYVGSYNGKFEGTIGSIVVGKTGSTLTARFIGKPANGNDILGGTCGSSIGQMLKIDMDGSKVDYAIFAFDPGNCAMNYQGRELVLDFKHDDGQVSGLNASLYVETTTSTEWQCGGGGYPGGPVCFPKTMSTDRYATGKFKK